MELKFIFFLSMSVSLYDVISCDVINVKNFLWNFEVLLLNSGYAPDY